MSAASPSGQPATVNLGGGFVYLKRADGHSAIIASSIAGTGAVGMMSAADVNARDGQALRQWLQWWAFPDHARLRMVHQIHSARVVAASSYNGGAPEADGLWTRSPSDVLVIRAADCAPVWIVDPPHKTIALAHAGWRGVASGILEAAVEALREAGAFPEDLHAAVGPRIGPCCFEVGPEVAERFAGEPGAIRPASALVVDRKRGDSSSLDLGASIAHRLRVSGVDGSRIDVATACTRCHPELFHSYRRNGTGGPLMAAIGAVLG